MDDIQWYARRQIASSILYWEIDHDMSELHQLPADITQRANEVFIWVRIVIEELIERFIDGSTISQLRETLSVMPEELKDLYQRALSKVKPEYALESYVMAQIVLHAKNPQTLESLLKATDIALQRKVDFMPRATMERRLRSRCRGLLEQTSTSEHVQFLHQTVKTFFSTRYHATSMFRNSEDAPAKDGSYYMLIYCNYIATRLAKFNLTENSQPLKDLFTYARESSAVLKSELAELLECLVEKPRCCAFFPWDVTEDDRGFCDPRDGLQIFFTYRGTATHSHYALQLPEPPPHQRLTQPQSRDRYFDLMGMSLSYGILSYTQYKCPDTVPRTPPGRWPLLHSAVNSALTYPEAPKLVDWLLQKGADPNECCRPLASEGDNKGPTALSYILSAYDGYDPHSQLLLDAGQVIYETVETLLRGGANPNILFAVESGRSMSALGLVTVWASGQSMNTFEALLADIEGKCGELIRMLLKYGADINQIDTEGYRPLYYALKYVNVQATELLLQHGAKWSDLGNGMNASRPESFQHNPGFFRRRVLRTRALLSDWPDCERQSRRSSGAAGDT